MKKTFRNAALCLLLTALNAHLMVAYAQGTAFTYQGRLNSGANPANGTYDFVFAIYGSPTGTIDGFANQTNSATPVSNGLFTVTLNLGQPGIFTGPDRWLEIDVRTNGNGAYTALAPRQQLTPTPYAITAGNVTGSVAAGQVTGPLTLTQLPGVVVTNGASGVAISGTFSGNGAGVTNVGFGSLNGQGLLAWSGNFVLASSPGVGSGPQTVTAADVNGDGNLDLISANHNTNTLSVLTNNGSGGFVLASSPVVGRSPTSVVAADVNGDGKLDLISANGNDNNLSVLTNNGSGGFVLASSPGVGNAPISVVAADVNGDGKLDLISANNANNTLSVLTNNGSGGFVLASSPGVGNFPFSVVAADVNGDGKEDLISANSGNNTLSVLTNNGSSGFVLASSPGVSSSPISVVAADVNGDGKLDLIAALDNDNALAVLTNNGSGGFVLASSPGVGSGPWSVAAADVNGDGRVDLISANLFGNTLSVLTNNGSGGFVLASSPGVGSAPTSVVAVDANGDGRVDLISANINVNTLSVLLNAPTFTGVFSGDGSGFFNLNAANISSGTLADARLPVNVALLDASQNFSGANSMNNAANSFSGNFSGDGSGMVNLSAANISSGTLASARLAGTYSSALTLNNPANSFSGNGAGLTGVLPAPGSGNYLQNQTLVDQAAAFRINGNGIFNGGSVGIGKTNPATALDVNGDARLDAQALAYNEGLALNFPTNMSGSGGYGGIHFHSTARNGAFDANSIKWAMVYNYAPETGIAGNGLAFVLNNTTTRLYLSTNGNVGIGTLNPTNKLMVVNARCDGSSWINASDRNLKQGFAGVDAQAVLAQVAALPVTTWSYKAQPEQKHLGPVAQDFRAAFGLGQDDTSISTVDESGVALAAIQGLNRKLEETRAENAKLKQRLDTLEKIILTQKPN